MILPIVVRGGRVTGMILTIVNIGRARGVGVRLRCTSALGLWSVLPVVIGRCRISRVVLSIIIAGLVGPSTMKAAGVLDGHFTLQGCVNNETTR